MNIKALALLGLFQSVAIAHPGHDVHEEAAERRSFMKNARATSLSHCLPRWEENGVAARNIARRSAHIEHARQKRQLKSRSVKRDADEVLAKSHNKTELGYTPNTDPETLFSSYNSCILSPTVTQGPYYVGGEYVRSNVIEDQAGVEIILDYQVIDVDTCEPVPDVYLEIWHCNATGVYSGVNAGGNGDSSDTSLIDATWLRGIQPTDDDGVAQFESIFPGHYTGRTAHIHIMVHANATLLANETLGNDIYSSHVGQAYFDQTLIDAVEELEPYVTNSQELTLNVNDGLLASGAEPDGVDPLMEYALLGDQLEDGLFAWLAYGFDSSVSNHVEPAVFYYEDGGVENPNGGGGGPGGPPS